MKPKKRLFLASITISAGLLLSIVLILIIVETQPLEAFARQEADNFLPVILGNDNNVPSPTTTGVAPPATNTPTATNTIQPSPTSTSTPTATNTPLPTDTPTPTSTPTRDPRAPNITSFTAYDDTIPAGGSTYLKWLTTGNLESLVLDPGGELDLETIKVQVSPSEGSTYTLTASNSYGLDFAQLVVNVEESKELLVFDWNKPVLKNHHGFPFEQPPRANGDWTTPVNFAGGKLYFRVIINSQPIPQSMFLQYCFWQGEDFSRENCTREKNVAGNSGNVVTWDVPMSNLLITNDIPVDFTESRKRYGIAIKNSDGMPVSDYLDFDWGGEDPDEWYPLDMQFTIVVVAEGEKFSGWDNYAPEQ